MANARQRRPRPLGSLLLALVLIIAGLAAPLALGGCQPRRQPERQLFDDGEEAFRNGHYDRAIEQYEAFLKASPEHQLARLAQERILTIERELEVVMGRRNGPRPIYLRPVVESQAGLAPGADRAAPLPGALDTNAVDASGGSFPSSSPGTPSGP